PDRRGGDPPSDRELAARPRARKDAHVAAFRNRASLLGELLAARRELGAQLGGQRRGLRGTECDVERRRRELGRARARGTCYAGAREQRIELALFVARQP